MDELTQWQMEEAARRGRELQKWLENNSGMIDAMRRLSEQHQALINTLTNSGFIAEVERTAALIRAAQNSAVGVALQFQATYAEMIAALAGLHWHYEGIGTTLTVTLDEDDLDKGTIQERRLTLPANHALALGGEITMSGDLQIEVIKGNASLTQDDNTLSATGQIVEGRVSLVGMATLTAKGTVINATSNWSIERSANSQGQHGFIFRGVGGEEMRRKVDFLADVAQWVMGEDESAKKRVLSSLPFANSTSTVEISNLPKPVILNWRVSELKRWVEDFKSDTNADILLFHSSAKGYIDIYNEYPHPMVGMRCDHPVNGAIELIPYLLEGATPSAIADLQRWRTALEAAGGGAIEQSEQRKGGRPSDPNNDWAREQVHNLGRPLHSVYPEWLEKIGDRAKLLDDPYDSFKKAVKQKKGK